MFVEDHGDDGRHRGRHAAYGALQPTVNLSIRLVAPAPSTGAVHLAIPFDDWLRPQVVDERTLLVEKVEAITNGPGGAGDDRAVVRVSLDDAGTDARLVAHGTTLCRPALRR